MARRCRAIADQVRDHAGIAAPADRRHAVVRRRTQSHFNRPVMPLIREGLSIELAVADDLDLEGADDVADEADFVHGAAGGDQRRRDREEGIAGADRVDHLAGEGRDRCARAAALVGDAAVLAVGDDDLAAVDGVRRAMPCATSPMLRHAVAEREPRLRRVDADVVGLGILRDEVVAHVGAVALRVHGEERRVLDASAPTVEAPIRPWPKSVGDDDIGGRRRARGSRPIEIAPAGRPSADRRP